MPYFGQVQSYSSNLVLFWKNTAVQRMFLTLYSIIHYKQTDGFAWADIDNLLSSLLSLLSSLKAPSLLTKKLSTSMGLLEDQDNSLCSEYSYTRTGC